MQAILGGECERVVSGRCIGGGGGHRWARLNNGGIKKISRSLNHTGTHHLLVDVRLGQRGSGEPPERGAAEQFIMYSSTLREPSFEQPYCLMNCFGYEMGLRKKR